MKFTKFIKPELEQIKENANFTEEEERIFSLLCRGFSQKQISTKENLSLRTIEYRVRDLNLSWLKPRDSWELLSTEKIFTKLSR